MTDLRKLSEAATPGEWRANGWAVGAVGSVDTWSGPVWGRIATLEPLEGTDAEGRHWSCGGSSDANAAFIVALVNAFRSGSLIPRSEYERVLALLAEAREALRMVSSGLNNAFAAGTEEREYGSARRQEKAMEKVETTRSTARATLSRIDDALAAEPEARG